MPTLVEQADEVSIVKVCHLIGMDEVDGGGRATKYLCPFGEFYHSDPSAKAFRVYMDSNTAFCFGGCGFFSPTMLYAKANDFVMPTGDKLRLRDAATALLKVVGYQEPSQSSWDMLTKPKAPPVDTRALKQALDRFMNRHIDNHPRGEALDTGPVLAVYDMLIALLPQVRDEEQVEQWMDIGKQSILKALDTQGDGHG